MPNCYYYDEQRNRCNCYVNENLNELLSENAKLREVMEDLEECDQIHRTMLRQVTELKAKAKAENAKLRELVRSVLVLRHDSVFKWLDAAMAEVYGTSFTAQARELGVEVDDVQQRDV